VKPRQTRALSPAGIVVAAFACFATALTAFAQTAQNQAASVAITWEKAEVFVPGSFFKTTPDKVAVAKPLPVVIYLHGATGIDPDHDARWGSFIKDLGYIAVLPDSMARPGRKPNYDSRTGRGGVFPAANAMRIEETRYALEQVRKSAWADANNVFLMGHSEGGQAAARNRLPDFRGIIISGWTCTDSTRPGFDGIFAPLEIPILTLEWDHDAFREGTPQQGSCANKFGERKKARRVLLSGTQHGTHGQREARDAVAQFLKENLAP
jgi:dienelactone hydrolase